jgi:hypothetical protein
MTKEGWVGKNKDNNNVNGMNEEEKLDFTVMAVSSVYL